MTIYCISGLGADERAFRKLKLPEHYTIKHIHWIAPLKNETLSSYAKRLSAGIDPSTPFMLLGLSMGGMIAVEMSKFLKPKLTIIISSITGNHEIPWYLKLAGKLQLDKLLPGKALKTPSFLAFYFMGVKDAESKQLLTELTHDADPLFAKWAVRSILQWENTFKPENLFHIHGTNDNLLPIRFTKPTTQLIGGGHLMVFTMGDQVSEIINNKLSNLNT